MLISLNTAYSDTRADDLAWALGKEPMPALATLDLDLDLVGGPGRVQLRLLGASHQVILDAEHGGCSETVACLPGRTMPLPAGAAERIGDWDYGFAAHVDRLSRHAFTTRAQELLALVTDHPNGLAGTFPGDEHAFTALLVQHLGDRIQWRTWHAYPQEGQLVMTRTRIVRRS